MSTNIEKLQAVKAQLERIQHQEIHNDRFPDPDPGKAQALGNMILLIQQVIDDIGKG